MRHAALVWNTWRTSAGTCPARARQCRNGACHCLSRSHAYQTRTNAVQTRTRRVPTSAIGGQIVPTLPSDGTSVHGPVHGAPSVHDDVHDVRNFSRLCARYPHLTPRACSVAAFGITDKTLQALVDNPEEKFPQAFKVGRRRYFRVSDVRRWLDQKIRNFPSNSK